MGVPFFHMCQGQDGPLLSVLSSAVDPYLTTHLRTGDMIYVLGRRAEALLCDKCTHTHGVYFIQGLFATLEESVNAAIDPTYFVGPLPLGIALPHDPCDWPGLFWPLEQKRSENAESVPAIPECTDTTG